MSVGRRVPEAAPVVGLLLGLSFAAYALLFTEAVLATVFVAVTLTYAFTAWAIYHSPDPASVLYPDPVFAGAGLVGALVVFYAVVTDGRVLFGLFVALVVVVPAALYHAHYGESLNPLSPLETFAVAGVAAASVLIVGVLVKDPLLGAIDATLMVLAAEDYRNRRGDPLTQAAERAAVAVSIGSAVLGLAYFLFVAGTPAIAVAVTAAFLVVGVYFAMNRRRYGSAGRRR